MDLTGFWKTENTSADETEWMVQYVWKNPREAATSELASTQGQIKGVWKSRKWNPARARYYPTIHIFHTADQIIT